jgi:hypothetical protein
MKKAKLLAPGKDSDGEHEKAKLFLEQGVRESMKKAKLLVPGTSNKWLFQEQVNCESHRKAKRKLFQEQLICESLRKAK